jgi:hypothetical protein
MKYRRFRNKPECGTRSGYDFHARELNEIPCELCREANKNYFRKARLSGFLKQRKNRINRHKKNVPWTLVLETFGDCCYLCKGQIDLLAPRQVGVPGWEQSFHPDHIIPLSKGGADTLDNIRPAHAICNQRKSNKIVSGLTA